MQVSPNPPGFYSGVSLSGNHVPPFPPPKFDTKPAVLSWTGFERSGEGSSVFFQLSAAVEHTVKHKNGRIEIRMKNTKVNVRNNMRHLDLRFFKTPAATVKVSRRGRDALAVITLKRAVEPTVELVTGQGGYKMLVVTFPKVELGDGEQSLDAASTPPPAPE